MSTPVVLRVQPVYEKTAGRKRTLTKTRDHNSRLNGDLRHVDSNRTHLNQVLLGTGDVVTDVQVIASQYVRSSKSGPIAGEIILTANRKYFRGKSEAEREKWAKDTLTWAIQEFDGKGQGRVASCHWHRDEGAEHLHITVVPVATTTVGNQYSRKTVTAINYSAVLGKPPGGEKHLPPDQRRWGLKQTSYAEFMASCGHDLIRGVRNRKAVNKSPSEWRAEVGRFYDGLIQQFKNMPNDGSRLEFSKAEIADYIVDQVHSQTEEQQSVKNKAEALQQLLNDAANAIGCPNVAQLAQYAGDVQTGLKSRKWSCEKAAKEGAEIRIKEEGTRKQAEQEAARKLIEEQAQRPRRSKGERASKEERRAARAARKLLSTVPSISDTTTITSITGGYHHVSRIHQPQAANNQQHQEVGIDA